MCIDLACVKELCVHEDCCTPHHTYRDTQGLSLLHDEVDQLRALLEAAWILTVNDVKKSLIVLKNLQEDPKGVEQLFVQYTRSVGRRCVVLE